MENNLIKEMKEGIQAGLLSSARNSMKYGSRNSSNKASP